MIKAFQNATPREGEYIDPTDGLLHCPICHGKRQVAITLPFGIGDVRPRCLCTCQAEAYQKKQEERQQQERLERIKRRKADGLQGQYLQTFTFDHDNGQNPLMDKARAYVASWDDALRQNTGLLLFGDVGTGKSFFAGCIANALLERGVPVLMTSFPIILNRLSGSCDRSAFLDGLSSYDLLIIDDLGAERGTEYALEIVYNVVDTRYRSGKPMIVTTNLPLQELKNPPDIAHARIYDRILERCAPIVFSGKNLRTENAARTKSAAKAIVSGGTV